jgi:hypothetical protein
MYTLHERLADPFFHKDEEAYSKTEVVHLYLCQMTGTFIPSHQRFLELKSLPSGHLFRVLAKTFGTSDFMGTLLQ